MATVPVASGGMPTRRGSGMLYDHGRDARVRSAKDLIDTL
jgi:hypothetical protein